MSITLAIHSPSLMSRAFAANRMVIGKFHRGNVKDGVVDRPIDAALTAEL
jgi:hypothetical protein